MLLQTVAIVQISCSRYFRVEKIILFASINFIHLLYTFTEQGSSQGEIEIW